MCTMKSKMKMKTKVKVAQYLVRSSVHIMNLDTAINTLLNKERFIDVTLSCDGHRFHCHRLVLAACSPLFEELLTDNPTSHPIVIIPGGIKSGTLKSLIDFMYKGQTNVSQVGLKALMESAEMLQVIGLQYAETEFQEYFEEEIEVDSSQENDHLLISDSVDTEIVPEPENHEMENLPSSKVTARSESETAKKQNKTPKETIVDIIEIEDSQDVPYEEVAVTQKPATVANGSTQTINKTDSVDSSKDTNVNTKDRTVATCTTKDKSQIDTATQVTTVPTIRVKPTIKLINLFQLTGRPAVGGNSTAANGKATSEAIPWTYIHIPTRATTQATPTATVTEIPSTGTQVRPNEQPPLKKKLPNRPEADTQPTTSKLVEGADATTSTSSSVPSFLKFNSSSMAISVTNPEKNDAQNPVRVLNMATEPEVEAPAPMETTNQSAHTKSPVKSEPESNYIELGETKLCEADFPMFYAMIKKEREEKAAQLAKEKEEMESAAAVPEAEAEDIICQPNVSYICGGADEDDETYGNEETELLQQLNGKPKKPPKKRQSKSKKKEDPRFILPDTLLSSKNDGFKHPKTLLPLSGLQAGLGPEQLFFSHTDNKGKIIFHKDNSVFTTVSSSPPRDGVAHSPQTVILRNPRCNQPRHYSTESLFNALMAVKYGESIYRASRMHQVPRKTLRNWMKRWDIKSQFPMPKQLEDAAKKKRMTQNT